MHASVQIPQAQAITRLSHDSVGRKVREIDSQNSIPRRYRDGLGGINLERVRQDQRRARKQSIRAMMLWLRNRPR